MTAFYNVLRNFFRIPPLEAILARFTMGKDPSALICKLVPNPRQYRLGTIREVNRNGISLHVDLSDYIGHYIYYGFKDPSLDALFALCKNDFFVLDIGTNIGYSLLKMASLAPFGQLVGFEPDPQNYFRCSNNILLNPTLHNLRVFNFGLGDSVMHAEIEVRTPGNRGANRVAPVSGKSDLVMITRLDTIFSELNWQKLDLVKLDVEGYELKVLKGAESTLRKFYPILFVEINDQNLIYQSNSAHELILFLFDIGYTNIKNAVTGLSIYRDTDLKNQHLDVVATREVVHA